MANHKIIILILAFAVVHLSRGQILRGSVSCLDCDPQYDYSGIVVMVKCKQVSVTKASKNGTFTVTLPTGTSASTPSTKCAAKILISSNKQQLYVEKANNIISSTAISKSYSSSGYTISNPLSFLTSCPFSKDDIRWQARKSVRTKWSKAIGRRLLENVPEDDYHPISGYAGSSLPKPRPSRPYYYRPSYPYTPRYYNPRPRYGGGPGYTPANKP